MTVVSSRVSNCSLTAAEPRSNRKGGRLFWRDRSVGPYDDIALEKEQKYAIRKGHDDFKTGVPIECPRNYSPTKIPSGGQSKRLQGHFVAQAFQPPDQGPADAVHVDAIKVIRSEVP